MAMRIPRGFESPTQIGGPSGPDFGLTGWVSDYALPFVWFFAKVFGVNSVQIRASGTARASVMGSARYASDCCSGEMARSSSGETNPTAEPSPRTVSASAIRRRTLWSSTGSSSPRPRTPSPGVRPSNR